MNKIIAILFTTLNIATFSAAASAAEQVYIPWTFDNFDSNCELVESNETQTTKTTTLALETTGDEDVGELGW